MLHAVGICDHDLNNFSPEMSGGCVAIPIGWDAGVDGDTLVFGLYAYALDQGYTPELAQTMSMNMLVVLEIFHLFFIRNVFGTSLTWDALRGTRAVWISLAFIVPAQFLVTYWPTAQQLLGTRTVTLADGLLIVAIGAVFFAIIEVEKQLRLSLTDGYDR